MLVREVYRSVVRLEYLDKDGPRMGKVIGWFVGLFAFSTLVEKVGGFLFTIFILALLGGAIGESKALLVLYIIIAMMASYLLPIVLALYLEKLTWLVIVPVLTSLLFAVPSSLIFNAGCKAGNQEAVWAMRAVPIIWAGEGLLASSNDNLPSECRQSSHLY